MKKRQTPSALLCRVGLGDSDCRLSLAATLRCAISTPEIVAAAPASTESPVVGSILTSLCLPNDSLLFALFGVDWAIVTVGRQVSRYAWNLCCWVCAWHFRYSFCILFFGVCYYHDRVWDLILGRVDLLFVLLTVKHLQPWFY